MTRKDTAFQVAHDLENCRQGGCLICLSVATEWKIYGDRPVTIYMAHGMISLAVIVRFVDVLACCEIWNIHEKKQPSKASIHNSFPSQCGGSIFYVRPSVVS